MPRQDNEVENGRILDADERDELTGNKVASQEESITINLII